MAGERTGPRRLADFAGRWQLRRRIADFRARAVFRLEGSVTFRAGLRDGRPGLIEDEEGLLRQGAGLPIPTRRRAFLTEPAPGLIAVAFPDGRPFHGFALAPRSEARHDCAPDLYRAVYDFRRWPEWHVLWRVTGPAKDYASLSRCRPLPPG
jgi:hypothetical protein